MSSSDLEKDTMPIDSGLEKNLKLLGVVECTDQRTLKTKGTLVDSFANLPPWRMQKGSRKRKPRREEAHLLVMKIVDKEQ